MKILKNCLNGEVKIRKFGGKRLVFMGAEGGAKQALADHNQEMQKEVAKFAEGLKDSPDKKTAEQSFRDAQKALEEKTGKILNQPGVVDALDYPKFVEDVLQVGSACRGDVNKNMLEYNKQFEAAKTEADDKANKVG